MSDRDPAFLWETEALRGSPRRRSVSDRPAAPAERTTSWVTLREAHHATGIPVDTLRKWARKGAVSSFLDDSGDHTLRMVRLDTVLSRAEDLGRSVAPIPTEQPAATPQHRPQPPTDVPATGPTEESRGTDMPAPDGTMIVPIAAWDKMLMQLGNLHEAGQQLAEARERAAKAETEAAFLRERLGEMRRERSTAGVRATGDPNEADAGDDAGAPPEDDPGPEEAEARKQPEKLWRYIYRGWKERRRR